MTSFDAASQTNAQLGLDDPGSLIYRRITWRLVPFLLCCSIFSFLDRINIGFAQLQMKHDLSLGDAAYGLAAGAFFIGFFIFEIPSNLILQRIGARKTISRIMICWGIASASTMFVRTPTEFICLRILLGVFEAGFAPGVFLYLTYWFPLDRQGRVIAMYMSAFVVAGLVAGPISTTVMSLLNNTYGIRGWQWLFALEGLPSTILGIIAYFYLTDRPAEAAWLSADEKSFVQHRIVVAPGPQLKSANVPWYRILLLPRVVIVALCGFAAQAGVYVVYFWMPQILKSFGQISDIQVGALAALPYAAAIISMVLWSRHSDLKMERRWHFSIPLFIAALAFLVMIGFPGNLVVTMLTFTVATAALMSSFPIFWAFVTASLPPAQLAVGLALSTSVGSLGGLLSPALIGFVRQSTGKVDVGLYIITGLMVASGIAMLTISRTGKR